MVISEAPSKHCVDHLITPAIARNYNWNKRTVPSDFFGTANRVTVYISIVLLVLQEKTMKFEAAAREVNKFLIKLPIHATYSKYVIRTVIAPYYLSKKS